MQKVEIEHGLEFQMDEEISISPTSGVVPKSPADILAGAETELEKSARGTSALADTLAMGAAGGVGAGIAGAIAAGESGMKSAASGIEDKITAAENVMGGNTNFDMDFNLEDADKPAPMGRREPEQELDTGGASPSQLARPAAALELDKLDLSFDPERTTFEDPTPSVLDGQWHDAATKLDLAKAYQEMGDVEGAREILQEVLHEGDDQQKAEAKSLLTKLG